MADEHDRHEENDEKVEPSSESPAKRRRRRRNEEQNETQESKNLGKVTIRKKKPPRDSRFVRPTRRKIPDEPKDVEYPEKVEGIPKHINKLVEDRFFAGLIRAMEANKALTVVYKGNNTWRLRMGGPDVVGQMLQLKGKAYMDEVLSDEFKAHVEEWDELKEAEKVKIAKGAGAEWEEHKVSRINLMRCADSYRKVLGIKKYKPEYSDTSSRKAIRG